MNARLWVERGRVLRAAGLAVVAAVLSVQVAWAHQPYFEEDDFSVDVPFRVADPTVSRAVYGTLAGADDADYFVFSAAHGQEVKLGLLVPDIAGQADFAPMLAVAGPGLPAGTWVPGIAAADGHGAIIVYEDADEVTVFQEPFTGTRYWRHADATVTLPAAGEYVAVVWHDGGHVGRYTFVMGEREVLGGDPLFLIKLRSFWTAVDGDMLDSAAADAAAQYGHGHGHHDAHLRFKLWLEHMARCILEFFAPWMPST